MERKKIVEAPVYFRDMNNEVREEYLKNWKTKKRKDLLKSVENCDDVVVGYYLANNKEFVE